MWRCCGRDSGRYQASLAVVSGRLITLNILGSVASLSVPAGSGEHRSVRGFQSSFRIAGNGSRGQFHVSSPVSTMFSIHLRLEHLKVAQRLTAHQGLMVAQSARMLTLCCKVSQHIEYTIPAPSDPAMIATTRVRGSSNNKKPAIPHQSLDSSWKDGYVVRPSSHNHNTHAHF